MLKSPVKYRWCTLLWDLSTATTSPSSCIRIAIAVVFPPGAAHMSNILSPCCGSTVQYGNMSSTHTESKGGGEKENAEQIFYSDKLP